MTEIAARALVLLEWAILAYFLVINGFYLLLLVGSYRAMREHRLLSRAEGRSRVSGSPVAPSISMLAPAYNEEATIVESLRALLSLHYPNLEVVVINDGSSDGTMQVLRETFGLQPVHPVHDNSIPSRPIQGIYYSPSAPNLVVLDKENGGKADALNAGLNVATGELVCAMDADTLIEPDALQRMVRPFLQSEDVLAAGGTIRIANGSIVRDGRVMEARVPRHALSGFQVIEYLRAFLFGRLGWNRLGGNLIISGAFGLFDRASVMEVGGYLHDTVGEDMELVLRLRRHGYEQGGRHRIDFVPDPVAWTEAPESLRVLGRQRDRWHRGLADVLWRHRGVFFNPKYGAMGMVVFPYFVLVELMAPVVEAIGVIGGVIGIGFGLIDYRFAILLFLAAYGLGTVLTLATLLLEEVTFHRYERVRDRGILLAWVVLENFGYRQLTVIWRLRGMARYLRGRRDWGAMERRGFRAPPPSGSG